MDRRQFLLKSGVVAGGAAAGGSLAAPAIAQEAPSIRWRLTSSFPNTLDTLYGNCQLFSRTISELTDGKFKIDVFPAGELVPGLSALDAVQDQTVECAHTVLYYYVGKDPTFALASAIPFGMNYRGQNAWLESGGGMELLNEFYKSYNVTSLLAGNTGCQMGGWFRKEIKTPADLNGLKMRIGGFAGRVMSKLGLVPQQIAAGDIYPALEKGTIDAAEWVGPYDDEKLGFNRVAPYYYYPGWWEGGPQLTLYINKEKFAALPKEYQEMIRTAASHAHVTMQAKYDARNPQALKQLIANGAQVHRFPKDVMDAAFKARNEVYAELNDTNPDWKKIYTEFEKFLRDQYAWFRLADLSYDQYMASVKL